jgi:hypothetical protein
VSSGSVARPLAPANSAPRRRFAAALNLAPRRRFAAALNRFHIVKWRSQGLHATTSTDTTPAESAC